MQQIGMRCVKRSVTFFFLCRYTADITYGGANYVVQLDTGSSDFVLASAACVNCVKGQTEYVTSCPRMLAMLLANTISLALGTRTRASTQGARRQQHTAPPKLLTMCIWTLPRSPEPPALARYSTD